eukprot:SAG31_NODE_4644_length_3076_cov_2.880417_1_plen_312_part_00
MAALLDQAGLPPEAGLALHLLREKRLESRSKWAPFVSSVPLEYSNAPYWDEANMAALQDSTARHEAEATQEAVEELHRKALAALRAAEAAGQPVRELCGERLLEPTRDGPPTVRGEPTAEEWRWAWSTVMTRAMFFPPPDPQARGPESMPGSGVYCPGTDMRECYALVPLADLFNHADADSDQQQPCDSAWNPRTACYEFRAKAPLRKGREVFLCYGAYTNWQLLHQYGFVLRQNTLDHLLLTPDELCAAADRAALGEPRGPRRIRIPAPKRVVQLAADERAEIEAVEPKVGTDTFSIYDPFSTTSHAPTE